MRGPARRRRALLSRLWHTGRAAIAGGGGTEDHDGAVRRPRIQLALARGDLAAAEKEVNWLASAGPVSNWFALSAAAARLDAFVALGDRAAVEAVAPGLVKPRTYLEPFALRALGIVQEDEQLLRRAVERFEAMGLEWHAGKTRALFGR